MPGLLEIEGIGIDLMTDYIGVCEKAARAGGRILREMQGQISVQEKGPRDLVTEADLASQNVIREVIAGEFPDHDFRGEEDQPGHSHPTDSDDGRSFCWVVDPLDGTTNYVHQLPLYCVSVALRQGSEVLCGTVFDPIANECFKAVAGGGAYLNDKPLSASHCRRLNEALVAASFAPNVPRGSVEVLRFVEVLHRCQAVRRLGSAALNLCYVAAGRLDAYFAANIKTWDVAAGQLILREAGATITALDGRPFQLDQPPFVSAATLELHRELLTTLTAAKP
jgi:myo-inositol-1(or 4)-monophosphatase